MRNYSKNLETGKIELRFEKSDYMSMPEDQKRQIKSNFLFSGYIGAWVSRSKNNTWSAENVCKALGATFEGETGEKLSFAEQVERTQERAENRVERYEARAETAEAQSTAAWETSNKIASFIPFGQPILVGHHSEKRHRRDIEKIGNAMNKSVELSNKAEYYSDKAESAKYTAEGTQYSNPIYLGNRIAECETSLRKLARYLVGADLINKTTGEKYTIENPATLSDESVKHWNNRIAEETDKLNFFKEKLANCGTVIETKETLKAKKCTHVKYGGTWYPVKSFNTKSVTVLNWHGIGLPHWTWSVPYTEIKGIKTIEDNYVVLDRDGKENKPTVKF